MSNDYILRENAINALVEAGQRSKRYRVGEVWIESDIPNGVWELNGSEIREAIYSLPSADVRLTVRGRWFSKMLDNFRKYEVVCSECGARYIGNYDSYDEPYDFKYCPNCGARMEE